MNFFTKNEKFPEVINKLFIGLLLLGIGMNPLNVEIESTNNVIASDIQSILQIVFFITTMMGIIKIVECILMFLTLSDYSNKTEENISLKTLIQNKENKKEIILKIHNFTKKEIQELIIKEKLNKKESDLLLCFYEEEYKDLLKEEKILKSKIKEKKLKMGIKSSKIKIT